MKMNFKYDSMFTANKRTDEIRLGMSHVLVHQLSGLLVYTPDLPERFQEHFEVEVNNLNE